MSEPLFLQSVMQEKIWVGLGYVMSLAMTFRVKRLVNVGLSPRTQMGCLR